MTRKNRMIPLAVALTTALTTSAAHAEFTFHAGFFSDYILDGASASDNNAVVQGGVGYDFASGSYAGVFMSTLGDGNGQELTPYFGHVLYLGAHEIDFGYAYLHFSELDDADNGEVHLAVSRGPLTAVVSHVLNADDSDSVGNSELALGFEHHFDRHNRLELEVGHILHADSDEDDLTYWALGLARDAGDGTISLTYASTDENGSQNLFVAGYSVSF